MPLGYGYKERDVDQYQLNWGEIGKNMSDMLSQEVKAREQKRQAYEQDFRDTIKNLNDAPMGQFTPGNKFISDFASDMTQKQLMDYKLFKAGKMSEKDYIYNTQNGKDGTATLFDLQKLYQNEFARKMKGVTDQSLQPMNTYMMGIFEGFANFNNAKAIIDPRTNVVSIGKLKMNDKTGTLELTSDTMPVTVARNTILTDIPAFKVDEALDNTKNRLGSQVQTLYNAASITGAGTLTKLLGVGAIKNYPQFKGVIDDFNKALETHLDGLISDKYSLSSVLTMNTGKYDAESFTTDKDVAKNDPTKILLKIDPSTHLPIMDDNAPYYEQQKKEAKEWMRTQLLGRLDVEVTKGVTAQLQPPRAKTEAEMSADQKEKEAANFGRNLGRFISGTKAEKDAAANYFIEYGVTVKQVGDKFIITGDKGTVEYPANTPKDALVSAMLKTVNIPDYFNQETVRNTANRYGAKSATILKEGEDVEGKAFKRSYKQDVSDYAKSQTGLINKSSSAETINNYNNSFVPLGFTFSEVKDKKNKVKVQGPNVLSRPLEIDITQPNAENAINAYIAANQEDKVTAQSGLIQNKQPAPQPPKQEPPKVDYRKK